MKHHKYLQELVTQDYFAFKNIIDQDTGCGAKENLYYLTQKINTLTPIYFQGQIVKTTKPFSLPESIAVEDDFSAVYLFSTPDRILVTLFSDTRNSDIKCDAVLTKGVLSYNKNNLLAIQDKEHATYSVFDSGMIKISSTFTPYVKNDVVVSATLALQQLSSLSAIPSNLH